VAEPLPFNLSRGRRRLGYFGAGKEGRDGGAKPTGPLESHEWGNATRPRIDQQVYHAPKYRWEL
jgi:hypothetical protein